MPVEVIGPELPVRHTVRESRVSGELHELLDELRANRGNWCKVDEDQKDPERVHRKRYRYHTIMLKEQIEGYEFTVRGGVLYGRKK